MARGREGGREGNHKCWVMCYLSLLGKKKKLGSEYSRLVKTFAKFTFVLDTVKMQNCISFKYKFKKVVNRKILTLIFSTSFSKLRQVKVVFWNICFIWKLKTSSVLEKRNVYVWCLQGLLKQGPHTFREDWYICTFIYIKVHL